MGIWFYLGLALLIWVIYDLYKGVTFSYRMIVKEYEPVMYYTMIAVWFLLAISGIVSGI
jgi:hypothetical protein